MRQIVFITGFLLAFCCAQTYGQHDISGHVVDGHGDPIAYANVTAYTADSVFAGGCVSGGDGSFAIDAGGKEPAVLLVRSLGYATLREAVGQQRSGLRLVVHAASNELKEVVVHGTNTLSRMEDGKLVTTVRNTPLAKLPNAEEILKFVPGITDSKDGMVVFGKGAPEYYINGRKLYDLSELKRLGGDEIASVELVKNAGAEYGASSRAVINILTVKKRGDGLSCENRVWLQTVTDKPSMQNYMTLNYRKDRLDVFGDLSYMLWQDTQTMEDSYDIFGRNPMKFDYSKKYWQHIPDYYARVGFDYYFNKINSIGATYSFLYTPVRARGDLLGSVLRQDTLTDTQHDWQQQHETNHTHRVDAYYDGQLTPRLKLSFNNEIYFSDIRNDSHVDETSASLDDRTVNIAQYDDNFIFASELHAGYRLAHGTLGFGADYSYTHRITRSNNPEGIIDGSNEKIRQNVAAVYATCRLTFGKLDMDAGLRYEHNRFDYYSGGVRSDEQSRTYDGLYPTLALSCPFGPLAVSLSYTAKTVYPSYTALGSTLHYESRYIYRKGDPSLQPAKVHDLQLMLQYGFATLTLDYVRNKHSIVQGYAFYDPAVPVVEETYANYPSADVFQAYLTLQKTISFWQPRLSAGMTAGSYEAFKDGRLRKMDNPAVTVDFNNIFALPHRWNFYLEGNLHTAGDEDITSVKPRGRISVTVEKEWKSLQCIVMFNDIFKTQYYKTTDYSQVCSHYQNLYHESRNIQIVVRLKINSSESKYKGRSVADKEAGRM